jgi:hypothetical protein
MDSHPREARAVRHAQSGVGPAAPPSCALFAFRLPFDLPVQDGGGFILRRSSDPDEFPWVELVVRRIGISLLDASLRPYEAGFDVLFNGTIPDLAMGRSSQTWVLATTLNILFNDEPSDSGGDPATFLTVVFERCMAAINRLSQASRLVTSEVESRPLAKEALDSQIAWFVVDPESAELREPRMMRLHHRRRNAVLDDYPLDETRSKIASAAGKALEADARVQTHPLLLPRALAKDALGERLRGEATSSVVTLQTAAEGLLRGLHRLLLVDAGRTAAQVVEDDGCPFETLLWSRLPPLLGGRWSGVGAAPEDYARLLYGLRNRIVHAGRDPRWDEIGPAFDSYLKLLTFLDIRVTHGWRAHPRTLKAWCDPWAGGTLALPKAAMKTNESLETESAPYWLPHDLAGR